MKKFLCVLTAAAMLICMLSCAFAEETVEAAAETAESVGMANPWTECETLEEVNEACGTNLMLPGVMGVSDDSYRYMTGDGYTIGEAEFAINGVMYTLRGSTNVTEDISGLYDADGNLAFQPSMDENAEQGVTVVRSESESVTDEFMAAQLITTGFQYVFETVDMENADEEVFESAAEEIFDMIAPAAELPAEGSYTDTYSQRATADVTWNEDDSCTINIHWSSSATESNNWTMTCYLSDDGILFYNDMEETLIDLSGETEEDLSVDIIPDGYFELTENGFNWTGAAEESCQDCTFELDQ